MATTHTLPRLGNADIAELTEWRRDLHRHPELSGEEERTAATVTAMLRDTAPDAIVSGLGGHGVAALYDSGIPGPRVLLRCELDGLPIADLSDSAHRSTIAGKGHQCGHDGHMAILAAMARLLGRARPAKGSVVLMFQPAEEDGSGANLVVNDPAFAPLQPDYAFAIHNMPGVPFGQVAVIAGPACCASRGVKFRLTGRTAHASQPETGISPMVAVSKLMPALTALANGSVATSNPDFTLVTITHAEMGAPAFGVSPGEAQVFATLRALTDAKMEALVAAAETLAREIAAAERLALEIAYDDIFVTCDNDPEAVAIVTRALDAIFVPHGPFSLPLRGSEDFGSFGRAASMALMMLGAGEDSRALHNPDFDFPDELIAKGAEIYMSILREILG